MSNGRFSGMTTRQKVIAVAFVIIVIVIVWQVMGLFGGSKPSPTAIVATTTTQATMTTARPGTAPSAPANPAPDQAVLHQMPVSMDNQIVEAQKEVAQKYIDQLNQLQMLKVQREIADTNQAIATARLATVTAEKSISDLLTTPTAPPPAIPVPPGAYATPLVNPTPSGQTVVATQEVPPPPVPSESNYSVISVAMQFGKWNAVLGYEGKLYSVGIGDILPTDGSVVASINKNGVTLVKDGKRKRIGIVASI